MCLSHPICVWDVNICRRSYVCVLMCVRYSVCVSGEAAILWSSEVSLMTNGITLLLMWKVFTLKSVSFNVYVCLSG